MAEQNDFKLTHFTQRKHDIYTIPELRKRWENSIPAESNTEINCTELWEIYQYMVCCFSILIPYTPPDTHTHSWSYLMKLIQASKIWLKRVELCYEIVRNVRNSKARWKETYRYGDFGNK